MNVEAATFWDTLPPWLPWVLHGGGALVLAVLAALVVDWVRKPKEAPKMGCRAPKRVGDDVPLYDIEARIAARDGVKSDSLIVPEPPRYDAGVAPLIEPPTMLAWRDEKEQATITRDREGNTTKKTDLDRYNEEIDRYVRTANLGAQQSLANRQSALYAANTQAQNTIIGQRHNTAYSGTSCLVDLNLFYSTASQPDYAQLSQQAVPPDWFTRHLQK